MKKTLLTIAIVLGMTLGAVAQKQGGGLFGMGDQRQTDNYDYSVYTRGGGLLLPESHGETGDQNGPLGTGIAVLTALGAAYLVGKKRDEE